MNAPTVALSEFQGQPALQLRAPDGAQATVLVHGAHLVSWIPAGGEEQLYLSPAAKYGLGASVRGGVPVIFPQFNERGPLPRHGLVRTRPWQPVESVRRGGAAIGVLRFTDDIATRVHWKQGFEAELTVVVGGPTLEIELAITNTGETPFEFTAALHTYLRCNELLRAQLEGLQGRSYEDFLLKADGQQWGDVLTFVGAIDRIYHSATQPLVLRELGRRLHIGMSGFEDVVVWNPGDDGVQQLSDMPDEDWRHMLCVEAALIRQPARLAPGDEWAGMQTLSV
ncbi:D-hexose-6-phosphate mutarotase [Ideonella sp. 4Y16]|uniref:D-hexose-6-phosphate mutarotase n=1 Tax=Ideonella alba TaxID=2824118 RepID=UPI001B378157|nr:D-hexose-6-phosphate mutarotase [Ideonella alba]MBQ0945257.1 D-hexose-6-phosphate mutarotase [Ideonella alba]